MGSTSSSGDTALKPLLLSDPEGSTGTMQKTSPSRLRFWALFVFCMLGVVQNVAWVVFSTIVDDVKEFYHVTDDQVNRLIELAQLCFIPGVFIFSPLSDRFGLKAAFIASCSVVLAGALCRWLGPDPNGAAWRDP